MRGGACQFFQHSCGLRGLRVGGRMIVMVIMIMMIGEGGKRRTCESG